MSTTVDRRLTIASLTLNYLDSLDTLSDASLDGAIDSVSAELGVLGSVDADDILVIRQTLNREKLAALGIHDRNEAE